MKDVVQIAKVAKIWDGTAWVDLATSVPDLSNYQLKSEGGLTLVKKQTIGTAVSSVTVTDAFSATYDNYRIIWANGTGSTVALVNLKLGSTTTGYYSAGSFVTYNSASPSSLNQNNNGAAWTNVAVIDNGATWGFLSCNLYSPNLARKTLIDGNYVYASGSYSYGGYLDGTTQYTAFTLTPQSGTITGGTIYVYGYNKG